MSNRIKGIVCILISALGFALMNLMIPLAGPLPTIQKTFFRNLVALIVSIITLYRMHQRNPVKELVEWRQIPWYILFLRILAGTVGVLCNYYALDHLLISDASVLNKIAPFATLIFSAIFLKERLERYHIQVLLLAFIGVLFVTKPSLSSPHLFPYFIGIIGGLSAGAAYTCVRQLNQKGLTSAFIVFAFSLCSCFIFLPMIVLQFVPMDWRSILALLGAGIFASMGQFGITYAYKFAPASEISIYDYSAIIFTGILGRIFLNQMPDIWSLIGYFIIFIAGWLSFLYNRKKHCQK